MLESEYFAATAVHAGAWRQDKEYELVNLPHRKIPIAILIGQHNRKNAEIVKALRGQAETLLSNDSAETIRVRRNEVRKLVEKLQQEADELQKQMEKLMK